MELSVYLNWFEREKVRIRCGKRICDA